MATITQTIPSFVQGISTQPDELKLPGQVRDVNNAIPDVAKGLVKRPGTRLIAGLTAEEKGKWFTIDRDETEKYMVQILTDGSINIWSTIDGAAMPVYYSAVPPAFQLKDVAETNQNLKPDPLPDDWVEPNPVPTEPDPTPTPDPNQGNEGDPLYPGCDNKLYSQKLSAYRKEQQIVDRLEVEVQTLKTRIKVFDEQKDNPIVTYQVEKNKQFGGSRKFYIVDAADIKGKKKDYEVGKPSNDAFRFKKKEDGVDYITRTSYENLKKRAEEEDGRNARLSWYDIERRLEEGDLYSWGETTFDQDEYDQAEDDLKDKKAELADAKVVRNAAREEFETVSAVCGINIDPFSKSLNRQQPATRDLTANPILRYFKIGAASELQHLTINDYTFITNRKVIPTMSDTKNLRPNEAFVSLKLLKYNSNYQLYFNTVDDSVESEVVRTATKIVVNKAEWEDDEGDCPATAIENFTVDKDDGTATALSFQLETRGQAVPKNGDPYDGYICEYTTSVRLLNGGNGWKKGDKVTVTMNDVDYTITVKEISKRKELGNLGIVTYTTPVDGDTIVDSDDVLQGLATAIADQTFGLTATVIGSGIHVQSPNEFQVTTNDSALLSIMTESVNDISQLPEQCRHGYVTKVANSTNDEDDYYVVFEGDQGISGAGRWVETVKPGIYTELNGYSMPHQIVRLFDENGNIYFRVSPIEWESRLVGDDLTNPIPSFVGKSINKIGLFRNRLTFLSDENVVMSRPGDFFNFFSRTAMAVSPIDPIDVSTSSSTPSVLFDSIEVNAGLLVFSAEQQFLITTDNDVLTPDTVKVNGISNYGYNTSTAPIPMGTTVGFVNDAGKQSRFMEITNIRREGEAEVLNQSKVVERLMPNGIDLLAHSKVNNIILLGKRGSKNLFGYRYFNTGEKRVQSAWFRLELPAAAIHMSILDDTVYLALDTNNEWSTGAALVTMQSIDLIRTVNSALQRSLDDDIDYDIHLDSYTFIDGESMTFDIEAGGFGLGETSFEIPMGYNTDKELYAWSQTIGEYQGQSEELEIREVGGVKVGVLVGDRTQTRIVVGHNFRMEVEMPTLYMTQTSGERVVSDTRANLNIHRLLFNFNDIGVFKVEVDIRGKRNYVHEFEQTIPDGYAANDIATQPYAQQYVPVYDRNEDVNLTLVSDYPTPASVISMTWEGDINTRFYRRV